MNLRRWTSLMSWIAAILIPLFAASLAGAAPPWAPAWLPSSALTPGNQLLSQKSLGADAAQSHTLLLEKQGGEAGIEEFGQDLSGILSPKVTGLGPIPSSNPAWTWQNPIPPAERLTKARFMDESEGWVVSFSSGLLHTLDGGKTWDARRFGPPLGFYDVYFSDWQHGWAVGRASDAWSYGDTSIIWCTVDGGKTWKQQYSEPDTKGFGVVQFTDNLTGWVVATTKMLKTTDGGETWKALTLPADVQGFDLTDFVFLDSLNGWLLVVKQTADETANLALRTSDGGETWVVEAIPVESGKGLYQLSFVDSEAGWAAGGGGAIWQRTPTGWKQQANPHADVYASIVGIQFFDQLEGWAVSKSGHIMHTVNGGGTWILNAVVPRFELYGMVFSDRYHGWVFGPYGVMYRTTDGGMVWQNLRQGTGSVLMSASFVDSSTGWISGSEGAILHTSNGGKTWTSQTSPVTDHLWGIDFISRLRGWAVGESGKILATRDGGRHWSQQASKINTKLSAVSFVSPQVGWAVGNDGIILKTTNGGATWIPQESKTTLDLCKVQFVNANHGWIVGNGDKAGILPVILRTEDGGKNWTAVEITFMARQDAAMVNSLHFINALEGWACGAYTRGDDIVSVVVHTTDGGKTWTRQEGLGTLVHQLMTIWFTDNKHGYVAGENGVYYTTADGGLTWKLQIRPCPGVSTVLDMTFTNTKTGFMVGAGGAILKTSTGGVTP